MESWCAFGIDGEIMRWSGHDEADPASFAHAVEALVRPGAPDPSRLAQCRAGLAREIAARFAEAEALRQSGRTASLGRAGQARCPLCGPAADETQAFAVKLAAGH